MKVNSRIKINTMRIKQLTQAQITALEKTAEALHTEVVQAQVMPRDTGAMQNEATFVDYSKSNNGKVSIVTSTPYARRMYFHPEFNFQTDENPNAQGKWYSQWLKGGEKQDFCKNTYKKIYKGETGV